MVLNMLALIRNVLQSLLALVWGMPLPVKVWQPEVVSARLARSGSGDVREAAMGDAEEDHHRQGRILMPGVRMFVFPLVGRLAERTVSKKWPGFTLAHFGRKGCR